MYILLFIVTTFKAHDIEEEEEEEEEEEGELKKHSRCCNVVFLYVINTF